MLVLRTGNRGAGAAALTAGCSRTRIEGWSLERRRAEITSIAGIHAYVVSCVRAAWWAQILTEVRDRLFAAGSPLKRFDDSHFRRFLLVAMIVAGGVLGAQAAFAFYFVPITRPQYLQVETYFPIATATGVVIWALLARAFTTDLRRYLATSRGEAAGDAAPPAAMIYRRAQALPYQFALLPADGGVVRRRGRRARWLARTCSIRLRPRATR